MDYNSESAAYPSFSVKKVRFTNSDQKSRFWQKITAEESVDHEGAPSTCREREKYVEKYGNNQGASKKPQCRSKREVLRDCEYSAG